MGTIFLLSPANLSGKRGALLVNGRLNSPVGEQLRAPGGAPMGDVFSFVSALYLRGKLTYARRFERPPDDRPGTLVITPTRGLCPADEPVTPADLRQFAKVDVHVGDARYRRPLERTARELADRLDPTALVVLLGSIASPKYVDVLLDVFGTRLHFPPAFVGRGDMSRGGLLLRAAAAGTELDYLPVAGAIRHGPRPPKLAPLPRGSTLP